MLSQIKSENEDIRYLSKQLMLEGGMLPSAYQEEDYFELLDTLAARPREDRPISAAEFHKRGG
jgi:hypothetical protein